VGTPIIFCIVRSVRLIGHNSSIESPENIRAYISDLTNNGFAKLRDDAVMLRDDDPGDGTLRNVEYVTLSDLFQSLYRFRDRVSTAVRYTQDDMSSRFGNTVVTTGADGRELGRTYYDADGNVIYVAASGSAVKATWYLEGDQLCITPAENPTAKRCAPFHGPKRVGDIWKSTSGREVAYTLQRGRP